MMTGGFSLKQCQTDNQLQFVLPFQYRPILLNDKFCNAILDFETTSDYLDIVCEDMVKVRA